MPGMNKTEVENDKKNDTRTKGVKPWNKPGCVKRDPKMCPNCKRVVYHKPERCLEFEINKENRRDNWKSVLWHGEGTWMVVGSKTKTKVQDSVKNKLARSDSLHDYWSPLNWLDDKPEKVENAKRQNGKTRKGTKNEIGEEITLEMKRLEDDTEQLLGEFETINSAANEKLDSLHL